MVQNPDLFKDISGLCLFPEAVSVRERAICWVGCQSSAVILSLTSWKAVLTFAVLNPCASAPFFHGRVGCM